tara:strand:- start:2405 stop:3487 length:1083 start_codon:yes stop_codon:yes gene_type:complete
MKKWYVIICFVFLANVALADEVQSDVRYVRNSISQDLNEIVKTLKGYFHSLNTSLDKNYKDSVNMVDDSIALKTRTVTGEEMNPKIMPHGREKVAQSCSYDYQNLAWDGTKWYCVNADAVTDCDPAADEYAIKLLDGSYKCARTASGVAPTYYWKAEGSSHVCNTTTAKYNVVYGCYYKNKLNYEVQVDNSYCGSNPKPAAIGASCAANWVTSSWSGCSNKCGTGTQTRSVTCPAGKACLGAKPAAKQACRDMTCQTHWRTGSWGYCQGSCSAGVQTRNVYCPSGWNCVGSKPSNRQACSTGRQCCNTFYRTQYRSVYKGQRCNPPVCVTTSLFGTQCQQPICMPQWGMEAYQVSYQVCH